MGSAHSCAELKFTYEDTKPHWENFDELKKVDLKGQTLTIFGPWRGEDEGSVRTVLEYFREATGAEIKYSSSENYEQQIVIDTQAGSPPNIAVLPQPGLIQDLASKGLLVPLGDETSNWVKENYGAGQSWVDLGTFKDKDGKAGYFAFPYKADVKSLVWYSPDNFEEAGYEVPKTQEELTALEEKIIDDGGTPWCIGLGSGGATGWPATDWSRTSCCAPSRPTSTTSGSRTRSRSTTRPSSTPSTFSARSPPTTRWWMAARRRWLPPTSATARRVSSRCRRNATCITRPRSSRPSSRPSSPEGTKLGEDADFFYYPPYASKPDLGTPVLGAGTLVTSLHPAACAFVDFLKMPLAHEIWMAQGSCCNQKVKR